MAQLGVARRTGAGTRASDAGALEADLRRTIGGDVRFDEMSRILYSTDASNYQIEPLGVALPRDADDVAAIASVCAAHQVPVIARGGGSGLAGQAIGAGLVIDFSAHMTGFEIDPLRRRAAAAPGAVLGLLNAAAAEHGLVFGPDPASADRACVGGVVGTNAAGAHSAVHGMTVDHVLAADVVLADGSTARFAPDGSRGGALFDEAMADLEAILDRGGETIDRDFPKYWRRAGGYNLDRALAQRRDGRLDPLCLLSGSEGTLALATALELALVELPARTALLVVQFERPLDPFRAVTPLLSTGPSAIELIDRRLLDLARSAPGFARDAALVTGDPAALLVVEYAGPSEPAVLAGLAAGERALTAGGFAASWARAITAEQQAAVWRVRKAGLGLLMSMRGDWKPASGIEDAAVPPERLAEYISEVRRVLADIGVEACFYAHASSGCIHVRPILNLKSRQGVEALKALGDATTALATALGGVISSEHGDGLARSARNEAVFGREVYALFQQVKAAFDPQGLLNPGKVVDAPDPATNLRYGPSYEANAPQARFAYPLDGDITRAIEQCNGAGVCRKLDTGAMCPSYMVTLDEEHSTRGRANALRAVIDGRLPPSALASDRLAEVMSLCVGCKACKTECPSGVDMARLRTEVLAARHAVHGAPVVSRLLANVHELERRLAPVAPAANFVASGPLWPVGARLLGIDPRRRFPSLQRETFDTWWRARTRRPSAAQVVLFADTFTTYQEPSIGRAAVAVLEAAGFEVIVPPRACCGRPALSQGLVETAVRGMKQNTAVLAPLARRGLPIIVPEPSCASALRDEAPDLLVQSSELREAARAVAAAVVTLDEFVAGLADDALRLGPGPTAALVHVHCHQRAHSGVAPSVAALRRIPGLEVHEPDAGCCGMAGGFGYRAETYAASIAMAERRLAPAVRAAARDTAIVAAGASCRQQIADTTGRSPLHPVELLARSLGRA